MSLPALYRAAYSPEWEPVEILGRHWPSGAMILRETGRVFCGIWLAMPDQVRIEGKTFIPGEAS